MAGTAENKVGMRKVFRESLALRSAQCRHMNNMLKNLWQTREAGTTHSRRHTHTVIKTPRRMDRCEWGGAHTRPRTKGTFQTH